MRIYLPITLDELPTATGQPGEISIRAVHTPTPQLAALLGTEDVEELEAHAQLNAALDCLELLVVRPSAPRRRAVVAIDVEAHQITEDDRGSERSQRTPSLRWLTEPIDIWQADCIFVDEPDTAGLVNQALESGHLSQELIDADLLWYDVSELTQLANL